MNFVQILDDIACTRDLWDVISVIKWALNLIRWAIPIILIVLTTIDVAKVVTAGNLDDKLKKEVGQKITTRLIYAIIIFLIPTIVSLLFKILPSAIVSGNWTACWDSDTRPES